MDGAHASQVGHEETKEEVEIDLVISSSYLPFLSILSLLPLFSSAEAEDAKKPSQGERPSSNLPSTLTRPCVVRSKVEDPELLRRRQEMQQSKSIHELSKISNVNEIPLPFKLPLPDIPLPTVAGIFSRKKNPKASLDATAPPASVRAADFEGYSPSASPISPDRTEHELLG